jgi:hypothetical protein
MSIREISDKLATKTILILQVIARRRSTDATRRRLNVQYGLSEQPPLQPRLSLGGSFWNGPIFWNGPMQLTGAHSPCIVELS